MSIIYNAKVVKQKVYVDRKYFSRYEDQVAALRGSRWLYVGNLSFHTTDMQIEELFSRVGPVKTVIMGVNSKTKTPCGFSFVEYSVNCHAVEAVSLLSGTMLDNRVIRVELDFGFKNGRHFGRGQGGGQVRDDRIAFDPGRSWTNDDDERRPNAGKRGRDRGDDSGDEDSYRRRADEDSYRGRDNEASYRGRDDDSDDEDEMGRSKRRRRDDGDDDGGR